MLATQIDYSCLAFSDLTIFTSPSFQDGLLKYKLNQKCKIENCGVCYFRALISDEVKVNLHPSSTRNVK